MLDTKKLLYILPDVAYIAELLPTKKEHTFSVHSFRQINGEFLDEDNLIAENVEKLFSKIEPETYHLVLPDFLFTNTIVEVKETQESKVKNYIKDELLPNLELTKDTHEIETFILTQHNNASKVQLTALERSALDPIVTSAKDHKVEITGISPLSWTIKSIVSLEPSITLVQIGSMLYLAEHYIGVDQCMTSKVSEVENMGESIKTLKGSQPSIQTIYLLTNELVESKLKDLVSKTLPLQQLASFKEDDSQMPSYVKQIIESGMKTLSISDYPVPQFALPKTPSGLPPVAKVKDDEEEEEEDKKEDTKPKVEEKTDEKEEMPLVAPEPPTEKEPETLEEPETPNLPLVTPPVALPAPSVIELPATAESVESVSTDSPDEDADEETEPVVSPVIKTESLDSPVEITKDVPEAKEETATIEATSELKSEPNLHQFAPLSDKASTVQTSSPPVIIKNKSGNASMVRMIFITLAVFCATVAIGVGIGLGVLSLANKGGDQVSPVASPSPTTTVSVSPSPVVSPSPTASSSATTADKAKTAILVVNATTTPGYAGTTKSKLEKAGYKPVKAANAKGEYQPGFYVLMKTEDPTLVAQLAKDTGLELTFATGYATEDPKAENQAVIVLAK
jgi:hypothetical protein